METEKDKKIKEMNDKITFEEFKEKVNVEMIGFDTSEEGIDMSNNGDGIVEYAIGKTHYKQAFELCQKQEILFLVVKGLKIEISLYKNLKLLMNYSEEDKKELWS